MVSDQMSQRPSGHNNAAALKTVCVYTVSHWGYICIELIIIVLCLHYEKWKHINFVGDKFVTGTSSQRCFTVRQWIWFSTSPCWCMWHWWFISPSTYWLPAQGNFCFVFFYYFYWLLKYWHLMHRGNIVWSILLCSLIDMLISKLCSAEFHCITKCIYQFSVAVIA